MSNDYVNVPKARPYNYLILRHLPGKGILLPFVEAGWSFGGALPPRLSQYHVVLAVVGERFAVAAVFGL